jgi:hypothetical protein
MAYV